MTMSEEVKNEEKVTESGIVYFEYPVGDKTFRMFVSSDPKCLKEEGETYEEFRQRRKMNAASLKRYKRGRVYWNPHVMGNQKGLVCNERNRATVSAYIEQIKQQQNEQERGEATQE